MKQEFNFAFWDMFEFLSITKGTFTMKQNRKEFWATGLVTEHEEVKVDEKLFAKSCALSRRSVV
jgi:hypothetical protein